MKQKNANNGANERLKQDEQKKIFLWIGRKPKKRKLKPHSVSCDYVLNICEK